MRIPMLLAATAAVLAGCATDAGQRSITTDSRLRNVSVAAPDLGWTPEHPVGRHSLAALWGDFTSGQAGILLELPGGFKSGVHAHTADYRAIVISGTWIHVVTESGEGAGKKLTAGSYWTQPGNQMHSDECVSAEGCVFFRFTEAKFETYTPSDPTRR